MRDVLQSAGEAVPADPDGGGLDLSIGRRGQRVPNEPRGIRGSSRLLRRGTVRHPYARQGL
jgi:hypothetical protein